jgi:class 3 adenylate cyclase/Tfp pilus assembly protein PilF
MYPLQPIYAQSQKIDSLETALKRYQSQMRELRQTSVSIKDSNLVNIHCALGQEYLKNQIYEKAHEQTNDAIRYAEKIVYRRGWAKAHRIKGSIYELQISNQKALAEFKKALRIDEEAGNIAGMAKDYNRIGEIYENLSNYPMAMKYFEEALKLCKAIRYQIEMGNAYTNIGNIHTASGNYKRAIESHLASLKIWESIGDKNGIASAHGNLGNVHYRLNNYEQCIKEQMLSLNLRKETKNKAGMANCYHNIAATKAHWRKFDEALNDFYAARKLYNEIGDPYGLNSTEFNIGEMMRNMGNHQEALIRLRNAKIISEEIGEINGIALAHNAIGKVYLELGKIDLARIEFIKGLKYAKEIRSKPDIADAYLGIAKSDSARQDYRGAWENLKLFNLYQDSTDREQNDKEAMQVHLQFEFEKKELESKRIADQEIKKQKIIRNAFTGGFAIVVVFAGVFFRQRNKTKQEKIRAEQEKKKSEDLLLNILPQEVATELKLTGEAKAKAYTLVTVMFTDFKDFTVLSQKISAELLVEEIHQCFSAFDRILEKYKIEKIKTIGDAYMCASGLPISNYSHAYDMIFAAKEIRDYMLQRKAEKESKGGISFELRIGIHSGPVVAGIVGQKKYAYDIWGDTVNLAARMESSGEAGKINVSDATYELVKDKIQCEFRGEIEAKGKGKIKMYYVKP